jgi:hypothetical protein
MSTGKNSMVLPRLSVRALAVGLFTMLALDLVSGIAVLVLWPGATSTSADVVAIAAQPAYLAVTFVLGTMTTAVGGCVCARLAPRLPYWHAAAFGILSVVMGLLLSDLAQPLWFTAMAILVTIPSAVYGAHVSLKQGR